MNEQNLIPNSMRSPTEVRENGRKGGINSGRARREKRTLRELIDLVLSQKIKNTETGEQATKKYVVAIKLCERAIKGDIKAIELLTKILGEQKEKVELTGKDGTPLYQPRTLTPDEMRELFTTIQNEV